MLFISIFQDNFDLLRFLFAFFCVFVAKDIIYKKGALGNLLGLIWYSCQLEYNCVDAKFRQLTVYTNF